MFAIHLALKSQSEGCLNVLIKHDKECLHDKDKKYNASPLHWTKSSQVNCCYYQLFGQARHSQSRLMGISFYAGQNAVVIDEKHSLLS